MKDLAVLALSLSISWTFIRGFKALHNEPSGRLRDCDAAAAYAVGIMASHRIVTSIGTSWVERVYLTIAYTRILISQPDRRPDFTQTCPRGPSQGTKEALHSSRESTISRSSSTAQHVATTYRVTGEPPDL
ncbi:hypothetical protein CMUS01_09803 [Colletotrichum musicola]|uniref:Uncharacterized protein n=1 Tax=Colletotrichum musicola TaxID=2175873 RepID=A0A8H6NAK3_9PEZI|nr:hypothetical protein CMUS01_09803 [Colletotrichum musicola]